MKNDTSENAADLQTGSVYRATFSCLFTAHRRVTLHRGIQQRTPLKVTLVTEPIKSETSQTCLESNLSRT